MDTAFESFFLNNPDLSFISDLESNIFRINDSWERMLGYSEHEIQGRKLLEFIHSEDIPEYENAVLDVSKHHEIRTFKNRLISKHKRVMVFETTIWVSESNTIKYIFGISKDLSKQKAALEELNNTIAKQKKYSEMLLNTIPSAVFSVDNDYIVTSWNKRAEQITGLLGEDIIGKKCFEFALEPCRTRCGLQSDTVQKPIFNRQCTIQNKDGEVVYISKNVDVLKDDDGNVTGGIECFDDITNRLKVEQLLKESEERYSAIVNNAPEIVVIHKKGKIVFVNNSGMSIAGYPSEEILGKKIVDFLTEQSRTTVLQTMIKRETGENGGDYEVEFITKYGKKINFIVKSIPISYEKEAAILAVLIDITSRKKYEAEMLAKEKILAAVATSLKLLLDERDYFNAIASSFEYLGKATGVSRICLFQNNYDNNGNGRISQKIHWNSETYTSMFNNLEIQDIPFEQLEGIVVPLQSGRAFCGVVRELKCQNAKEFLSSQNILSSVLLPIIVKGKFWGFIGFGETKYERAWTEGEFSTLTAFANSIESAIERRQIEEELEASKISAESANVMKSQFLANMSHEIRTPMNGILGFMELLQRTNLSTEQKDFIREAKSASELLLYLINDILDFSKIEAGKLTIEKTNFRLRTAVEDAVSILVPKANEKQLELYAMINSNVPEEVVGDPTRLRQVLNNLVSNAVKFTEKGVIAVKVNSSDVSDDKAVIDFEVSDTGIGINKETINRLFKPFTQADNSTTRKFGGTGLWLVISKELVRLMGGEIYVESMPGKGSSFKFSLQMQVSKKTINYNSLGSIKNQNVLIVDDKEEPQIVTRHLVNEEKDNSKPKILLVEDNETNRKLVATILKKHNLFCDIAINGAEAVKAVRENEYDIVFMDCQMPVMDGYESTSKIRELEGDEKHTIIVAMTANAMEGDSKKCIDAGMDDYISKPISFKSIFDILEKYSKIWNRKS